MSSILERRPIRQGLPDIILLNIEICHNSFLTFNETNQQEFHTFLGTKIHLRKHVGLIEIRETALSLAATKGDSNVRNISGPSVISYI